MIRKLKKQRGLTKYLNEKINYGGTIKSRGDVISEMQKLDIHQRLIDAYMLGAKREVR